MNLKNYFEKVDDFFTVEGLKNNWAVLSVATVFLIGLWLRYLPEQGMQYLQALDPYMIYRNSQHLAYSGTLPATDFMQYFPYNAPNYLHNLGNIVFPAVFYWMGPFLFFENFLEWAQFYPALMGALSVVVMYFFGKEVFDSKKVGVASAFFLATLPGVMRRTSAGFFEKEPIGTFFMMCTFYFFTRAWKREEYLPGIASGLSLAFFSISWGGSRMMWLLLPLIVGSVMFIDEDIHKLIVAYTPTVLIGAGVSSSLNYGKVSLTAAYFIGNFLLLGLLWSRYLVEEFELVKSGNLKYYTPSISILGLLAMVLSPLYSNFLADKWMRIMNMATQSTGSNVIGSTVAENQAPGLGAVLTSLGSVAAGRVHWSLNIVSNVVGGWPLMMIGISFMGTMIGFMLLRKYDVIEKKISDFTYFAGLEAFFVAWSLVIIGFFLDAVLFSIGGALGIVILFVAFYTYLEDEAVFKLTTMLAISVMALEFVLFFGGSQVAYGLIPATIMVLGGIGFMYFNEMFGTREIEINWLYVVPMLWILTNLLGAVAKSRLIFLSTFSVAFAAGYGFTRIFEGIQKVDFNELFEAAEDAASLKYAVLGLLVGLTLVVNVSAGFVTASGIGGSPGGVWDQSLDYMENQTEPGSSIMSWWDYGYHFESIGRRPSIANGWNAGYYTENTRAVNMPLADFFTASDPNLEFLEKHSVDYIVLDHTMIGKYSAVSTISNKAAQQTNETVGPVRSMLSVSTSSNTRESISQSGNLTTVQFSGQGLTIYAPVQVSNNSVEFSGAPTIQRGSTRLSINCVMTENGTKTFDVESEMNYCLAEDPYYSLVRGFSSNQLPARAVLVPKSIQDASLVQLYLEDGKGLDWVEKVPEGSNDYLKMWKVTR